MKNKTFSSYNEFEKHYFPGYHRFKNNTSSTSDTDTLTIESIRKKSSEEVKREIKKLFHKNT